MSSTFSQLPTAVGEIAPGAGISGGEWEGRFTFRLDLLSGFGCGGWASARGRGRGIFVLGMRAFLVLSFGDLIWILVIDC
jgi:hypothetical protein